MNETFSFYWDASNTRHIRTNFATQRQGLWVVILLLFWWIACDMAVHGSLLAPCVCGNVHFSFTWVFALSFFLCLFQAKALLITNIIVWMINHRKAMSSTGLVNPTCTFWSFFELDPMAVDPTFLETHLVTSSVSFFWQLKDSNM